MTLFLLFGLLAVLVLFEVPIAFALMISSVAYLIVDGTFPAAIAVQRIAPGLESFVLLAIPLFVLTGNLMNRGGIATRIFDFALDLVGHIRGSLGHVNILSSIIFAGMSGVAQADAAGLGTVEIREMRRAGYDASFSAAVTAASAIIGPIIPPSVIIVIYAALTNASVPKLFLAGIVPGAIIGLLLMLLVYFLARTGRIAAPVRPRSSIGRLVRSFVRAVPALAAPVILVGGMLTGVATPTELGAITVIYATALGFIYRDLTVKTFIRSVVDTVLTIGVLVFIIATAVPISWIIAVNGLPAMLATALGDLSDNPYLILAIINISLLLLGLVMDTTAILLITVPVLLPITTTLGIDPVHFGIVVVFNLLIGTLTPPFGILLFIMMDIANISFRDMCRAIAPFYVPLFMMLLVLTYFPALSMALPRLVFPQ